MEHGKLAQHPPWQSLLLLGVSPVHSESAGREGQVVPISDSDLDGTLQSCCTSVSSISHVETFDFASNEHLFAHVMDALIAVPHLTLRSAVGEPDRGASFVARLAHAHSEQPHEGAR